MNNVRGFGSCWIRCSHWHGTDKAGPLKFEVDANRVCLIKEEHSKEKTKSIKRLAFSHSCSAEASRKAAFPESTKG